jgi:hypothetical protein
MSCATAGTSYNINGSVYSVPNTPSNDEQEVCRATQIIERLHKDFTEKYDTANIGSAVTKPSYYLRFQPTSNSDNAQVNRFYANLTNSTANNNEYNGITYYRKMISAIMKGENDTAAATYESVPDSIRTQVNFNSSPDNFKGIYGVNRVVEILEQKINDILVGLSPSSSASSSSALTADSITKFGQRKDIKNTLEEVAYRENQIYREKFLNIILIVVGIFVVGSQLVQRYFSGGEGGGGGAGLGSLFGFGFGGSGGLFSRFGGLGLGSSGRSRIGNLFTNSSYALKQRQ